MKPVALLFGLLLVLLAIVIFIAGVRNKYLDMFTMFSGQQTQGCVTPWNLAWAIERPWIAKLFLSEPLEPTVALFLVPVIRAKQLYYEDVCVGYGVVPDLDKAIDIALSTGSDPGAQSQSWEVS